MKTTKHPLNLFFIEIIIALLFFSISGAVIMTVFAGAEKKTRQSEMLEDAIVFAQSVAEVYSLNANADSSIKTVTDECGALNEKITLKKSEQKTNVAAGTLSELTLIFSESGKVIYEFRCSAYLQNGGGNE